MEDVIQQLKDLRSFGYTDARRSFGGPFLLQAPDGRIVSEKDFGLEIYRLLTEEGSV